MSTVTVEELETLRDEYLLLQVELQKIQAELGRIREEIVAAALEAVS